MRTIISHFYNEEYLLPWWLRHHVPLFDHGILINHASTDASVAMCKTFAPHWRVVNSTLSHFDAIMTDFEVMKYEEHVPGFKIALTTTEFLLPVKPLDEIERELTAQGKDSCAFTGVIMVDDRPAAPPIATRSLPVQKHSGYVEMTVATEFPFYNRIYHNSTIGQYQPGRHRSYLKNSSEITADAFIFKYKNSPWTDAFLRRKLQIGTRIDRKDIERGFGAQHLRSEADVRAEYESELAHAHDLKENDALAAAISGAAERWS